MPRYLSLVQIDSEHRARRRPEPGADAADGRADRGDHQGGVYAQHRRADAVRPGQAGALVGWSCR